MVWRVGDNFLPLGMGRTLSLGRSTEPSIDSIANHARRIGPPPVASASLASWGRGAPGGVGRPLLAPAGLPSGGSDPRGTPASRLAAERSASRRRVGTVARPRWG